MVSVFVRTKQTCDELSNKHGFDNLHQVGLLI